MGDTFLKYLITGVLGQGGQAWVYSARDEFFERDVAIKILHQKDGLTEETCRRGRNEARALSRLHHPNVVVVFDAGVTPDRRDLYIIMELLEGRPLRDVLRTRGRLTISDALPLFAAIADGVHAAHELNVVHRDIKPENVIVLHDNTPKVVDFGIAKLTDVAGFTTKRDVLRGTVLYLAPEQLEGFRASPRSDVHALGLMLYEALSGRHPCLVDSSNPAPLEIAWTLQTKVWPRLDAIDPAIPAHVARAVDRALLKQPEQRYQSMAEFAGALRASLSRYLEEATTHPEFRRCLVSNLSSDGDQATDVGLLPPATDSAPGANARPSSSPRRDTERLDAAEAAALAAGSRGKASALLTTPSPGVTRTARPDRTLRGPGQRITPRVLMRLLAAGAVGGTALGGLVQIFGQVAGRGDAGSAQPSNPAISLRPTASPSGARPALEQPAFARPPASASSGAPLAPSPWRSAQVASAAQTAARLDATSLVQRRRSDGDASPPMPKPRAHSAGSTTAPLSGEVRLRNELVSPRNHPGDAKEGPDNALELDGPMTRRPGKP